MSYRGREELMQSRLLKLCLSEGQNEKLTESRMPNVSIFDSKHKYQLYSTFLCIIQLFVLPFCVNKQNMKNE